MNTTWKIDPMHSEVGFKVRHMMISNVNGSFGNFNAVAYTEGVNFENARLEFEAHIDSINTGVADRDAHLKSDDFFNAETYPLLSFVSEEVSKDGDELTIKGQMKIRDVSRSLVLKADMSDIVIDPYSQTKVGLSISGKIKRNEFGLKWNAITEAGNVVVGDEIKLSAELQFVKQ